MIELLERQNRSTTRSTRRCGRRWPARLWGADLPIGTGQVDRAAAMIQGRYAASSLVAITMFLAVGFIWGADQPTLEELAAAIDRVRTEPDGERVVAGHISRRLAVSVEALRAQRVRTGLDWGELLIANLLCKNNEPTVDHVAAEFKAGTGWAAIAQHHDVNVDQLRNEVQQSQQAIARRSEDRAPPRTSESQSNPVTTAPTTVLPTGKGSGSRY
jgi:hypothetical protein